MVASGKLLQLKADAKAAGWDQYIRTAADERAVLEGCVFDLARARRVAQFGEKFIRHSTGRWASEPFILLPYQETEIVFPMFGWVRPDGRRRFRYAFIYEPKKNGKSALASYLSIYLLAGDGEKRAEVYATATDRQQAGIVFEESARMVRGSPALAARMKVIDSTKTITFKDSAYRALSGEHTSSEGKNIHGLIIDELHAWTTPNLRKQYASLYYGSILRDQPLSIVITTAGDDIEEENELWVEEYQHAKAILTGDSTDTRRLAYIAEASAEDVAGEGWKDPTVHAKANPSYGDLIDPEEMTASAEEAESSPRKKAIFLRYRLNRPTRLTVRWIPAEVWGTCATTPSFEPGCECFGGLDLSSTDDFTALALVRREPEDGILEGDDSPGSSEDRYHVKMHFWVPEDKVIALEKAGKHSYRTWQRQGLLEVVPGPVIERGFVRRRIAELSDQYKIVELAYDPWNADETRQYCEDELGLTMVEYRQGFKSFSEPMKKVEVLARLGKLSHGGNRILSWMIGNTKAKTDESGNIRPVKPEHGKEAKIDGVVAMIMAIGRAMLHKPKVSVYSKRGLRTT